MTVVAKVNHLIDAGVQRMNDLRRLRPPERQNVRAGISAKGEELG